MNRARKADKRGRSGGTLGSFVAIERYLMHSKAWLDLKPMARACYLELASAYSGSNNGRIVYSARMMAERLGTGKATASRAILELEAHGFVETAQASSFQNKIRMAAEYRLAAFMCDKTGALASKGFMRWEPNIQNTVSTAIPNGFTCDTVDKKRRRKQAVQFHQRYREVQNQVLNGFTSGPLLYSGHVPHTPHSPAKAGAANQRASVPTSPHNSQNSFAINNPAHGPDSFTTITGQPLPSLADIERTIAPTLDAALPWQRISQVDPLKAALARLGGAIRKLEPATSPVMQDA